MNSVPFGMTGCTVGWTLEPCLSYNPFRGLHLKEKGWKETWNVLYHSKDAIPIPCVVYGLSFGTNVPKRVGQMNVYLLTLGHL